MLRASQKDKKDVFARNIDHAMEEEARMMSGIIDRSKMASLDGLGNQCGTRRGMDDVGNY